MESVFVFAASAVLLLWSFGWALVGAIALASGDSHRSVSRADARSARSA
jgi:hypothetical protein